MLQLGLYSDCCNIIAFITSILQLQSFFHVPHDHMESSVSLILSSAELTAMSPLFEH